MADIEKPFPVETEKVDNTTIEYERAQLLAHLPDPDEGKTIEERQAIEKKLMWKVDLALIPWLSFLYLLSFLDRTNIGNARLAGLEVDLGMVKGDYNNALTIFFVSYAVVEPATNALLKKITPRLFFTLIILTWGLIMTLMGLVTNVKGLLVARFFLGMAEAGLFPGVNYYLSCWYKSSEIGIRSSIFFSAAALAGSFGGLLAAVIAKMDGIGGKPGWAWIFILEGLATVVAGLACWWLVFDWPATASFLSPDDRIRVQRRLIMDRQGRTAEDFDKRHMFAALKDWKTYGYMLIYMGCLTPLYAFSLFLPTIIAGMGHAGTKAQLLSVPPYAVAAALTICVGFYGDRTRQRGFCNIGIVLLGIAGFAMLIATSNPTIQYIGVFLGAAGIYPTVPNTLSWLNNNTEGSLKRAFVLGVVVGWGNLNGVVSSNIYLLREKPRYYTGHGVVFGYLVVFLLGGSILMHLGLRKMNRDRSLGKMDAHWDNLSDEQKWVQGDLRPDFKYAIITIGVAIFSLAIGSCLLDTYSEAPLLNPVRPFEFINLPRLYRFMRYSLDILKQGAEKFPHRPYRLFCEWGELVILPPESIDEIKNDKRFDFGVAASDDNHAYIPGFNALLHDPFMSKIISRQLTQALGKLTAPLSDEAAIVMKNVITDSREWHVLNLREDIANIVTRMSSRVFMGEELCHDEGWNKAQAYYTMKTFQAMMVLCMVPRWLRPYIHWILPPCWIVRRALAAARKQLAPHIARRQEIKTAALARGEKSPFDDTIEWFAQSDSQLPPADCQISLSLAAIHTTTDLLSQVMIDIATHPVLFTEMRKEITDVLSTSGITKTALSNLKLMDSVVKESQRLKPILLGWRRQALADAILSNGIQVKQGQKVAVTSTHMWSNENYDMAKEFNPYRFMSDTEKTSSLVSTSSNHLGFGHGMHACPGRFFAAHEVKIALCHLLLKYDWKFKDDKKPEPVAFGMAYVANPFAKLMIRRREGELDLSTLNGGHG
ncbi:major facilitator superfamily transporter [Fusarium sp. NRRL 52700]|nr:major facilitator superfamily transporter [Fusarium sp. NRRL 52700]